MAAQHFGVRQHLFCMGLDAAKRTGTEAEVAFAEFYRTTRERSMRLAWLLTHDAAACDDVIHDAYTRLYHRFATLDRPEAYLRTAIVNRVRERGRAAGNERRRIEFVAAGRPHTTDGPTGGILDAVAHLNLPQRTVVVLRYWADLPVDEIAEILGVRPGTVRSLLSRATATLKQELEP